MYIKMKEKITLEQFINIKEKVTQLLMQFQDYFEEHENDKNFDFDLSEKKFIEQAFLVESSLFNCDLSDIPFEAWQDFYIISDENHVADFSKTRANIDFNMVTYPGYVNFKGCNVRNLEMVGRTLKPKDFDEETIRANSSLFLSDSFSEEFKDKYYSNIQLKISDLVDLTPEQLQELEKKKPELHLNHKIYFSYIFKTLGLDKVVQLYNHSKEDYGAVSQVLEMHDVLASCWSTPYFEEFLEQIKNIDVSEMKNLCFDFLKDKISIDTFRFLQINLPLPEIFRRENPDIDEVILVNSFIPDEVIERYFNKKLKLQDLIDYSYVFRKISVNGFLEDKFLSDISSFINDNYGFGKFQELVRKHPGVFAHISEERDFFAFSAFLQTGKDLDSSFDNAVKEYFFYCMPGMPEQFRIESDGQITYNVPEWLSSMNFKFVDKIESLNDLMQYNDSVVVLDENQRYALEQLNIDNIRKLEQETGIFSHNEWFEELEIFKKLSSYMNANICFALFDFHNGSLSYDEFLNQFLMFLGSMTKKRKIDVSINSSAYFWIESKIRETHPEIFADFDSLRNIPKPERRRLTTAFDEGSLTFSDIKKYPELVSILKDKNLKIPFHKKIYFSKHNYLELLQVFGNEKFLELCAKYGEYMSGIVSHITREIPTGSNKDSEFSKLRLDELSLEQIAGDKEIDNLNLNKKQKVMCKKLLD